MMVSFMRFMKLSLIRNGYFGELELTREIKNYLRGQEPTAQPGIDVDELPAQPVVRFACICKGITLQEVAS